MNATDERCAHYADGAAINARNARFYSITQREEFAEYHRRLVVQFANLIIAEREADEREATR